MSRSGSPDDSGVVELTVRKSTGSAPVPAEGDGQAKQPEGERQRKEEAAANTGTLLGGWTAPDGAVVTGGAAALPPSASVHDKNDSANEIVKPEPDRDEAKARNDVRAAIAVRDANHAMADETNAKVDATNDTAKADATNDTEADAKADAKNDTKADAKADAKNDTKADARADATSDTKADATSDTKADARADATNDTKADTEADATDDTKAGAKTDARAKKVGAKPRREGIARKVLRWVRRLAEAGVVIVTLGCLALWCSVPNTAKLAERNPASTAFIDLRRAQAEAEGRPWNLKWTWRPIGQISRYLRAAIIYAEDYNFYRHDGVDWGAIETAMDANRARGAAVIGGSTITQQLAKNLYLSPARSYVRKVRELLIAFSLEDHLSKQRILELYLNVVEWGDGVFGAEAAAQHWYGHSAISLSPGEAVRLAIALPNPFKRAPNVHTPELTKKAVRIIRCLRLQGLIDAAQERVALDFVGAHGEKVFGEKPLPIPEDVVIEDKKDEPKDGPKVPPDAVPSAATPDAAPEVAPADAEAPPPPPAEGSGEPAGSAAP